MGLIPRCLQRKSANGGYSNTPQLAAGIFIPLNLLVMNHISAGFSSHPMILDVRACARLLMLRLKSDLVLVNSPYNKHIANTCQHVYRHAAQV